MRYKPGKRRRGFRQGTYHPKNRDKYTCLKDPVYRSSWELKFFQWCDNNENVLEWASESVIIPYVSPFDQRIHRYFVDNTVVLREGDNTVKYLIEIKPKRQTRPPITKKTNKKQSTILYEKATYVINQVKWAAAKQWCEKHGHKFLLLTEDELFNNSHKTASKL